MTNLVLSVCEQRLSNGELDARVAQILKQDALTSNDIAEVHVYRNFCNSEAYFSQALAWVESHFDDVVSIISMLSTHDDGHVGTDSQLVNLALSTLLDSAAQTGNVDLKLQLLNHCLVAVDMFVPRQL